MPRVGEKDMVNSSPHPTETHGQFSLQPDLLPAGVELRPLVSHRDARGSFTEIFRGSWRVGLDPVQWNFVESRAGVLRGVHFHLRHGDYLVILRGRASIGLCDLRPDSPTAGRAALVELRGDALSGLAVPPGVAHGFYFHEPSTHVYAVSHYWDLSDELGCRWDDPALEIPWPQQRAHISPRDEALPSLETLLGQLRAAWRG